LLGIFDALDNPPINFLASDTFMFITPIKVIQFYKILQQLATYMQRL
jgi:hypothetical protein